MWLENIASADVPTRGENYEYAYRSRCIEGQPDIGGREREGGCSRTRECLHAEEKERETEKKKKEKA